MAHQGYSLHRRCCEAIISRSFVIRPRFDRISRLTRRRATRNREQQRAFPSCQPKGEEKSSRGVNHAKADLMGDRCCCCFGSGHDDGRSFASRRHCAAGLAWGRRYASSHGKCPSQNLERPALLLVQHRMAGRRLVRVWLQVAARPGLGRSGRVARVETPTSPSPGSSSAIPSVEARPAGIPASGTTSCHKVMISLPVGRDGLRSLCRNLAALPRQGRVRETGRVIHVHTLQVRAKHPQP